MITTRRTSEGSSAGSYRRRRAPALALAALLPAAAPGADAGGNHVVWGAGQASCNTYLRVREAGGDLGPYMGFLMGYLTAYNALTPDTYRISGNRDLERLLADLAEQCDAHRLDSFALAIAKLIDELAPERLRSAPRANGAWTR